MHRRRGVVGDLLERRGGARREHEVAAVLGTPAGQRGAEAAAGTHDHHDLVVDEHGTLPQPLTASTASTTRSFAQR